MYIKHSPERIKIKGYKRDDCTVNAIGTALGISYDLSRKILQTGICDSEEFKFLKRNPRTKNEFIKRQHVKKICAKLSVDRNVYISDAELNRIYQTTENDNHDSKFKNNTLAKFAECNPDGIFIVLVKNHLTAVINGKIVDTWDSSKRAVEVAYRVDVEKARDVIADLAKFYRMNSKKHINDTHLSTQI